MMDTEGQCSGISKRPPKKMRRVSTTTQKPARHGKPTFKDRYDTFNIISTCQVRELCVAGPIVRANPHGVRRVTEHLTIHKANEVTFSH